MGTFKHDILSCLDQSYLIARFDSLCGSQSVFFCGQCPSWPNLDPVSRFVDISTGKNSDKRFNFTILLRVWQSSALRSCGRSSTGVIVQKRIWKNWTKRSKDGGKNKRSFWGSRSEKEQTEREKREARVKRRNGLLARNSNQHRANPFAKACLNDWADHSNIL